MSRSAQVLTRRALNRATLARQLLLERAELPVEDALERLAGLQAQTPHSWYVGLWTRLTDVDPAAVGALLEERRLVRIAAMRSTIHLLTAADALTLRAVLQPAIERLTSGTWGRRLAGIDLDALADAARELLETTPLTPSALGRALAERWPGHEPEALWNGARMRLALVQVPPRGVWGRSGPVAHTTVERWLGAPLADAPSRERLLLRYLAAFGPASVRDAQTWSGLTRLAETAEALRPRLATFRDEDGRELLDLPDAPRPDADVPAPPRFLYDFDNLLLSHADRTRVLDDDVRARLFGVRNPPLGALLLDGVVAGSWQLVRDGRGEPARLRVTTLARPPRPTAAAVEREGRRLLAFLTGGEGGEVELTRAA